MNLKLFVIKNQDGQYFRAKGYGGSGNSWVDDVQKARIYAKIGPARAIVSFFAREYPQYGIPEIHQLNVSSTTVLNEVERVEKVIKKKEAAEQRYKKRHAEYMLKLAEKELQDAEKRVRELKRK